MGNHQVAFPLTRSQNKAIIKTSSSHRFYTVQVPDLEEVHIADLQVLRSCLF